MPFVPWAYDCVEGFFFFLLALLLLTKLLLLEPTPDCPCPLALWGMMVMLIVVMMLDILLHQFGVYIHELLGHRLELRLFSYVSKSYFVLFSSANSCLALVTSSVFSSS